MKKTGLKQKILVGLCLLVGLYGVAREFEIIRIFKQTTDGMMPHIAPDQLMISYKWADIAKNDVVTFWDTSIVIPGVREATRSAFVGRVIAVGGELFEIRDGVVWINGEATQEAVPVLFSWKISRRDYQANTARFETEPQRHRPDTVLAVLTPEKALEIQKFVPMVRFDFRCFPEGFPGIWGPEGAEWTMNHFGPVWVPPGHWFILGDNRDNSEDSRHRGFVPETELIGELIN